MRAKLDEKSTQRISLFLDAGANPHSHYNGQPAVILVSHTNDPNLLTRLLNMGANPNSYFAGGTPLLHHLTSNEQMFAALLQDRRTDLNIQNRDGQTALMYLAYQGFEHSDRNIIRLLCRGADPHIKDHKGRTALWYAENSVDRGYKDLQTNMITLLKEAMASLENIVCI